MGCNVSMLANIAAGVTQTQNGLLIIFLKIFLLQIHSNKTQ